MSYRTSGAFALLAASWITAAGVAPASAPAPASAGGITRDAGLCAEVNAVVTGPATGP
jgi:hypothetical protein